MRSSVKRGLWVAGGTVATLALVSAAAVAIFGVPHHAGAAPTTLYVGASVGDGSGCASPGYTSVQAAVDAAAPGDTVYLCASGSPYAESVDISKSITLTGDHDATIQPPSVWPTQSLPSEFAANSLRAPEALVFVWGQQTQATITGLTISGPIAPQDACGSETYGILALDGATATISDNSVLDISDPINSGLLGCQHGVAILIGAYNWYRTNGSTAIINDAAHATITGNTVSGYQKNGITAKGSGTTVDIVSNHVYGSNRDAYYSPIIAQNGIELAAGATGQIMRNYVSGNTYTGSSWASSSGIIVFGGCVGWPFVVNAQVVGNTLVNNDVGIYAVNYSNTDCYSPPTTQTNIKVTNNTISNDAVTNVGTWSMGSVTYNGYQAGINDVGYNDKVINNTISGAGYAAQQTPGGPFVLPIDTSSGPTTAPKIHANQLG